VYVRVSGMREVRRPKEDSHKCTKVHLSLSELDILMLKLLKSKFENTTYNDFHFQPAHSWLSQAGYHI